MFYMGVGKQTFTDFIFPSSPTVGEGVGKTLKSMEKTLSSCCDPIERFLSFLQGFSRDKQLDF